MSEFYNYKKIFYRRIILTPDNIRLWSITTIIFVVSLIVISQSLNWARNLPANLLSKKIKREYIAFLANENNVTEPEKNEPKIEKNENEANLSQINPEESVSIGTPIRKSVSQVKKTESAYQEYLEEEQASQERFMEFIRPEAGSVEPITSAIAGIPGYAGADRYSESSRKEKYLSLKNEEKILERYEQPINIPEPESFEFSSNNSNRDLQETTAIMEVNEVDVRYCFEKFARYDPSFSGNVLVSFTIHPKGYVIPSSIKIVKSNIQDVRVIRCIKKSIERWRNFPKMALDEGSFTVTRKYVF